MNYHNKLVSFLTQQVEQNCQSNRSWTTNCSDPTHCEKWTAYFTLEYGFETPEAGKHEGEICDDCGIKVTDNRCYCTDYNQPFPNSYEIEVFIPCWVTDITIKARTGEEYNFVWDNDGEKGKFTKDGDIAESMIETILSSGEWTDKEGFESYITEHLTDRDTPDPMGDYMGRNE